LEIEIENEIIKPYLNKCSTKYAIFSKDNCVQGMPVAKCFWGGVFDSHISNFGEDCRLE
jgi:hypothetical protein